MQIFSRRSKKEYFLEISVGCKEILEVEWNSQANESVEKMKFCLFNDSQNKERVSDQFAFL